MTDSEVLDKIKDSGVIPALASMMEHARRSNAVSTELRTDNKKTLVRVKKHEDGRCEVILFNITTIGKLSKAGMKMLNEEINRYVQEGGPVRPLFGTTDSR